MAAEVYPSEEKTEPFTPEELQLRLGKSIEVDDLGDAQHDHVPLHQLLVDEEQHKKGLRILVRPLTRSRSVSPGNDNCQWLALRAEVGNPNQPRSKVLAVTQTSKDINFSIRIPQVEDEDRPPLWCELYYDPASDSLILWNKSEIPIALARTSPSDTVRANFDQEILPGATREVSPGTWRISVGIPVLDFRILEKRPATLHVPLDSFESSPTHSQNLRSSLGKRSLSSDDFAAENAKIEKRLRPDDAHERDKDGVIIVMGPKDERLVFSLPNAAKTKEIAIPNGHTLLEVQKDETVMIPGGGELDEYQLTKRDQIATTGASSVFTAEHSLVPDGVITVKVLKTRGPQADNRPPDVMHRNVIRQAEVWLREYQSQADLEHESIVKLHGGDARYLSLYMEHVDGKDLAARNVWRDTATDKFTGTRVDAIRILKDIVGALNYVHQKKRIHNDIKPANILYSEDRGAVLCDFGLSTSTSDSATNGGTPYYVPPEFIGQKLRGPSSDVWALGVTMLYVLKKIPFPDARGVRGHPKQLYWMIADLNRKHGNSARASSAVAQMQQWLSEVNEAKAQLNPRDKIEFLVLQMLIPHPVQRITMAKVMKELHPDRDLAPPR
ncbi:putative camk protein kinase protein [Rosellinia necatrix]|uniref:Putative camk protein kinase protein n=1 Tax=Rosellinia necatrix TaxID=77044 RepID=A0A1W2TBI1_ROSNE|nr:putative camk protein kinase protein [Rosellinia necatrix]